MASLDGRGSVQGVYSVIPVFALNTNHEYRVSTGSWLPLMNTVGGRRAGVVREWRAVSYTHLTLPTILLV